MIGVVVVTHNRIDLLKGAIDSLRNQTYKDFQIVVVNNSSTDGTKEWLESQSDLITITQANTGGSGGFFTGMKYVAESGYEYCWIMDDDVVCNPTALEELLKAIQIDEHIGYVCSRIIDTDGNPNNVPAIDMRRTKIGYPAWADLIDHNLIKVCSASFVSLFLPSKRIFEFGLPYKDFFIWGDDTEYTSRIANQYNSYLVSKSTVVHHRAIRGPLYFTTETDKNRVKLFYYLYRNKAFVINESTEWTVKAEFYFRLSIEFTRLLFTCQFLKVFIILKSQWAFFFFHPTIEYPVKHGMME